MGGLAVVPHQQTELTPADGARVDFGWAVAISGSTAVVGAPHCFRTACPGLVYVFLNSGGVWSQQAELSATDGASTDNFGIDVAISGDTVVVGADGKDSSTGAVYVFVRSGTTWSQAAEITDPDGTTGDVFGLSVAISRSTILAAAGQSSSGAGAVYVFVGSGSSWMEQARLDDPDGLSTDGFGSSVAMSGSTAVVGAIYAHSFTGAAWVFVRSGTTWTQEAELTASDGVVGKEFGHSVSISSSTSVVGAPVGVTRDPGRAYVFVHSGSTWTQQAELTAAGATTVDEFGYSVAVAGSTALIGAYSTAPQVSGAAYVFVGSNGIWSQQAKLIASDEAANDNFGFGVALYRSTAVIGSPRHGSNGTAYVFVSV
jgi:hypothetical protein